jgi:hypothetical protein
MDEITMRLELLKLASGSAALPSEAEAVIKAANELEKFVMGRPSSAPERGEPERH